MQELTEQEEERLKTLLSLSKDDIKRLERIAYEDEKWEWFWTLTRKFGVTVFGITASVVAFREDITTLFVWLFSRGS